MLCALWPFAVPVWVIAGEHDEVVAKHVDDTRQYRLLGLARRPDVARVQILLRVATPAVLDPAAALFEMLMQPVDEERHPAHTGFQKRDPQSRMPIEDSAGDHRRHR